MKKKSKFLFSSLIKLGVGIGDWTKLKPSDHFLDSIEISSIDSANFDFLSKEELKQSHMMHYQLSDIIAKHLSKDMNVKIELHTVMITQMTYADFIQSLNSNVFQVDMNIAEFGNINVIFGANLASMMVNRLTGGKGSSATADQFTELERDILYTQFQEIVPHFQTVWNDIFDIGESDISLYSGQYKVDKRISYREAFVVFTFYLYFGGGELLRFMVAFPNEVLRRLMTAYNSKQRTLQPSISFREATLKKAEYDVVAKLGMSQLKMKDLQALEVDDVIPLSNSISNPISLHISDQVKLYAQPCIFNNKVACQIIGADPEQKVAVKLVAKDHVTDELPDLVSPPIAKVQPVSSRANEDLEPSNEAISEETDSEEQETAALEEYLPEEIKNEADTEEDLLLGETEDDDFEDDDFEEETNEAAELEDETELEALTLEEADVDNNIEIEEQTEAEDSEDSIIDTIDEDDDIDEDGLDFDEDEDLDIDEDDDDDFDEDDEFDFEDDLFDDFEEDEEDSI